MSLTLERYQRLRKQVDTLQSEHDRAVGALSQLEAQLAQEYGCRTLKEAERLLANLEQEATELERRFQKDLKAFEKEMKDHEDKWNLFLRTINDNIKRQIGQLALDAFEDIGSEK